MRISWQGRATALALMLAAAPLGAQDAPDPQTLADVREELTILNGQVQQIREELVRTGAATGLPRDPAPALARLDQLEAELRELTNRVDVVTNDVRRIVEDASNRVGDIEFRLTELEGGDVSALGRPEPLGGGLTAPAAPAPGAADPTAADPGAPELAVSERSAFEEARTAHEAGQLDRAVGLYEDFLASYPGGPLASEAQFWRGEALSATGSWSSAARSYLDSFSGAPGGPLAPRALYGLAVSLAELGQTEEACLTLAEVTARYPDAEIGADVSSKRQALACP
jgi:tol-pal system protein YbgF